MSVQRAAGLILTCVGTCALMIYLCFIEVYRCFQGSDTNYVFQFTYFPLPLCLAVPIIWICVGLILIARGGKSPNESI